MSKVIMENHDKVNITLHNDVSYTFRPSNGEILNIKIGNEKYKRNRIIDILTDVSCLIKEKESVIRWLSERFMQLKNKCDQFQNLYKKVKIKLYISLFLNTLLVILLIYSMLR